MTKSILKKLKKELKDKHFKLISQVHTFENDENDVESGYSPYEEIKEYKVIDYKSEAEFVIYLSNDETFVDQIDFKPIHFVDDEYPDESTDLSISLSNKKDAKRMAQAISIVDQYMDD